MEESYWIEIIFAFIGIAIVVIAVFVGLGYLNVGALESSLGAVGGIIGVVLVGNKKKKGKALRALDIGVFIACFSALTASLVALYFSLF